VTDPTKNDSEKDEVSSTKVTKFAAGYSLVDGFIDGDGVNGEIVTSDSGEGSRYDTINLGDIFPDDEPKAKMWLFAEMFGTNDATISRAIVDEEYVSNTAVRKSNIDVRTQVAAGSKVIKDTYLDFVGGKAQVVVEFVTEWVSTSSQDFDFTTYLTIGGKRQDRNGEGANFIGTLKNYEIDVYKDDDSVDTSHGEVAVARDFVEDIEVELGSGVSIFTKFFDGQKYYGTASRVSDDAADVVFAKYPDVDNVVILKTVGLNSTGDIVRLDTDYSDYYVYDADLNYLGQSNERLPFSSRYYLANRKLDTDVDVEPVAEEEPTEAYDEGGETGGDIGPSNANANPGTGC
jgi:hypothetical protein